MRTRDLFVTPAASICLFAPLGFTAVSNNRTYSWSLLMDAFVGAVNTVLISPLLPAAFNSIVYWPSSVAAWKALPGPVMLNLTFPDSTTQLGMDFNRGASSVTSMVASLKVSVGSRESVSKLPFSTKLARLTCTLATNKP